MENNQAGSGDTKTNCELRLCCRADNHAPGCTTYDPSRYHDEYATRHPVAPELSDEQRTSVNLAAAMFESFGIAGAENLRALLASLPSKVSPVEPKLGDKMVLLRLQQIMEPSPRALSAAWHAADALYYLTGDAAYAEKADTIQRQGAAPVEPVSADSKRVQFLIDNPHWSVRWRFNAKKQAQQWQMVDDGESWGQWGEYRNVLDAAILAQQANPTGEQNG